jgi:hypothetical protein
MKRVLITALLAAGALATAVPAALADDGPTPLHRALAAARHGTAKYHDVNAALADGYVRTGNCVEVPGEGGMGIHFLNRAYAADPRIIPGRPEELLYAPSDDGGLRLIGVEYFRADADQNLATDDDRPDFAGVPFDGPMLGHAPGMPIHYDLHVWVWRHNPSGMFNEYNPKVHC